MNDDPLPLIHSIYWLESSMILEVPNISPMLLKNTGLAHVHLVQNKAVKAFGSTLPPPLTDFFNTLDKIDWPSHGNKKNSDYSQWSSDRFSDTWGSFLEHPEASQDSQYATIKNMYESINKAVGKKISSSSSTTNDMSTTNNVASNPSLKKSKKKKKKTSSSNN